MKSSPSAQVQQEFGSKEELVKAIEALATEELWVDRLNEDKGLLRVSNRKLLRLHSVLKEVQQEFGSRASLVGEIAKLEGHGNDEDYKSALRRQPLPRLLDHYRSAHKRSGE